MRAARSRRCCWADNRLTGERTRPRVLRGASPTIADDDVSARRRNARERVRSPTPRSARRRFSAASDVRSRSAAAPNPPAWSGARRSQRPCLRRRRRPSRNRSARFRSDHASRASRRIRSSPLPSGKPTSLMTRSKRRARRQLARLARRCRRDSPRSRRFSESGPGPARCPRGLRRGESGGAGRSAGSLSRNRTGPFEQRGFHRVQRHDKGRARPGPALRALDRAVMQDRRRASKSRARVRARRTCW